MSSPSAHTVLETSTPTDKVRDSPVITPFYDGPYMTEPLSPDYTLASSDYNLDTPHLNRESEPIEAPETRTASPSDSTLPLSLNRLITQTSPTLTPSRSFYYRSTRYRSSYETPSSSPSPTSSPTLLIQKRYRGTSELILDTDTEDDESEAEGTDSGSEESKDEGLGYRVARCRTLELAEDPVPSMFEVGQSSRSVPNQQRADETPRIPTHPTWVDPEDNIVYQDIKIDPRSCAPVQTPASPELSSDSLPVSPTPLTIPSPVASPVTILAATIAARYEDQRKRHVLRMQHAANERKMQGLRERVAMLKRRVDRFKRDDRLP
nr:hypothetical protein [Tanacetum cinerariifolium]